MPGTCSYELALATTPATSGTIGPDRRATTDPASTQAAMAGTLGAAAISRTAPIFGVDLRILSGGEGQTRGQKL